MGLLSKTAQWFGVGKSTATTTIKAIDTSAAKDAFGEIFGANGNSPSFSSFSSMRQQMGSYYDWVYAAASRVAEECSVIDIELYINNTKQKNVTMGRRLAYSPQRIKEYKRKRITDIQTKNGRLVVRKAVPALEEVDNHALMDLLDHPNDFMSGVELFEMTFLHLELTGNSFWAIIRGKDKKPVELWPLYPHYMRIVPDEKEFIKGYVYTINGEQIPFAPEDIVHHKYSNPNDMRWGMSTVAAGARAIDTDTMAADYNRKFFYNSAQPDAVLYTDKFIDDKTWLRIKDQFNDMYGGINNAHKTAILEDGLKYQAMNPNQRDMEFLKSREFNRDMILAIFGVPKSVIGLDASMSRANAETAEYVFAKGTLLPKYMRLVTGIQEKLAPQFDERLVVGFTNPIPEDKDFKRQERKDLVNLVFTVNEVREDMGLEPMANGDQLYIQTTMMPIGTMIEGGNADTGTSVGDANEEDIHAGDGGNDNGNSSGDTGGDANGGAADNGTSGDAAGGSAGDNAAGDTASKAIHAVSKGPIPITEGCERCNCCAGYGEHYITGYECYRCDASGSVDKKEAQEPIPCGGREDSSDLWIDENGNYRHAEEKKGVGSKKKVGSSKAKYEDSRNKIADKYEPKITDGVLAHMKDQEKEVLANVAKRFKDTGKSAGKRVIKAKLDNLFDAKKSVDGWQAKLGITFDDIITAMGKVSVQNLQEQVGQSLPPYDPTDPHVEKFYTDRIRRVSVYFDKETQKQLGATLSEGIDAGEGLSDLSDRVKQTYYATQEGDLMWNRAERIGRTEPIFATTWTTLDSWKQSGVVVGKQWETANTDVCPFCTDMQGETIEEDLDTPWYEVGDKMSVTDSDDNEQSMNFTYMDVTGPPLHPNCRCTLLPIISED